MVPVPGNGLLAVSEPVPGTGTKPFRSPFRERAPSRFGARSENGLWAVSEPVPGMGFGPFRSPFPSTLKMGSETASAHFSKRANAHSQTGICPFRQWPPKRARPVSPNGQLAICETGKCPFENGHLPVSPMTQRNRGVCLSHGLRTSLAVLTPVPRKLLL